MSLDNPINSQATQNEPNDTWTSRQSIVTAVTRKEYQQVTQRHNRSANEIVRLEYIIGRTNRAGPSASAC
jgi:hypothetical protein